MMKPFQIRDLHGASSQGHEEVSHRTSKGVVQVSAADYDDIALNHPRARLTYLDEDDGDQIMVGSSLELSQRLDEPVGIDARLDTGPVPMHIFDIRRSNSVTELWRRFERGNDGIRSQQMTADTGIETEAAVGEHDHKEEPASHDAATASPPQAENQTFMEAFEAELASLLDSAENTGPRATRPESPPAAEPASDTGSQRTHHPLEVVAATFLYHLVNGANSVQTELRSRLPELQEQLRNAQRTVPENVRSSLQSLLATIEAHMRTAFQNLPDNGRQFAEDAINAGRPVAEHAADGFRMMASELNEASRTLFAAFENEFGRFASTGSNATSEGLHTASSPMPGATRDETVSNPLFQDTTSQPTEPGAQKEATTSSGPIPAQCPEINPHALPSDLRSPSWDPLSTGPSDFFYGSGPFHPPPFPPRPPHPPAPSMPPSHWPHWPMSWDPVHPIQHHLPHSPLPPPLPVSGMFPGQPWHPTDQWLNPFGPFGPHNAPPAPPPKEPSTDFHGPSDIPEKKVLFIGNVGFNVTERMIQDVFASKGFIVSVRLPRDSDTGMHAGFGYLEFPSIHPAMAAMDALQGVHIDGHAINLEFSDDAIIDSVHPPERPGQERTLYETFASHGHPGSQDSGVSAGQPARPRRASRRKSVTFQEPDLSSLDIQDQDTNTNDGPIRLQSPALIDLTTDDTVPNHQPNEVQDQLPEMSRFPPVSQLEAQLFANHRQSIDFDAKIRQEANESTRSLDYDLPKSFYDPVPSGPSLRRSNTVAFAPRGDFSDNPNPVFPSNPSTNSPLRRRASERHSLRRDTHDPSETDTWARLDRRERRRSRRSSQQSIPGSFPLEEPSQPAEPSPLNFSAGPEETDIDRCVSSLVDMGFGTAEDGGRARMAVYAAASNGNLYDAIDMIEEERKAYARQGQY
ncbi:hypothetical protein PoHVEF18_009363 [Penicillium ochrochloron]